MKINTSPLILLVDDNPDGLYAGTRILEHAGFKVITASDGEETLRIVEQELPDIVLLDVMMPKLDGLQVTKRLKSNPETRYIPIVLVSAKDGLQDVVEGLEAGADGYITKPFKPEELVARTKAAIRTKTIYQELKDVQDHNFRLQNEVSSIYSYDQQSNSIPGFIGESSEIKKIFSLIGKVSKADSPVLISGPSGSGKELVAKSIHYSSARRSKPIIAKNCAAFSEQLLESQLFGHVKGAFTGAIKDQKGYFESANNGTLFLDEIGEMPLHLQAKLLRVLQDGMICPVGSTQEKHVDVRVIAATNRDLREMVSHGTFREDLFFRLNVINIQLPSLCQRKEDIPLLITAFLDRAFEKRGIRKQITTEVLDVLLKYDWPGNIRELQNEVERLLILSGDDINLDIDLLSPNILSACGKDEILTAVVSRTNGNLDLKKAIEQVEKDLISEALKKLEGNKSLAAKELGISRSSLISKVQEYGLE